MIYVGLDPGVNGGIAALDREGHIVMVTKIPGTDLEIFQCVNDLSTHGGARACLEKVSAYPQMGVTSAFTFGRGFGKLLMALAAAGIPYDLIRPQDWQSTMGCRTGGDKNISKQRAQALFPNVKCTHAISDALLIAEFCRRFHLGLNK